MTFIFDETRRFHPLRECIGKTVTSTSDSQSKIALNFDDGTSLIFELSGGAGTLRDWWEHFQTVPFELFVLDACVLWFEVPYMERILGCKYHLCIDRGCPWRTGWYKRGKFLTEEL